MGFFSKLMGKQMRYIGVDVGTDTIKMVEVEAAKNGMKLLNLGMEKTPEGAIDTNNIIVEPYMIAAAMAGIMSREGFTRTACVSSLAGQALITRLIEIPSMAESELAETMKWEVERYIPFPANEIVLDYCALPSEDPESTQMEVLLAAAKKEMVFKHIEAIKGAKLDLVAIDIEPLALTRSLIKKSSPIEVPKLNAAKPAKKEKKKSRSRKAKGAAEEVAPEMALESEEAIELQETDELPGYAEDAGEISLAAEASEGFFLTADGEAAEEPENVMIVNIGSSMTDITILKHRSIGFNRAIPTGGRGITQAIGNLLLVNMEDAERIKRGRQIIPYQEIVIEETPTEAVADSARGQESVEDYDRILGFNLQDGNGQADAPAAVSSDADTNQGEGPETAPATPTLDLSAFFTQEIAQHPGELEKSPAEVDETVIDAAPAQIDDVDNKDAAAPEVPAAVEAVSAEPAEAPQPTAGIGDYQGLSLEALYDIEPMEEDILQIGASDDHNTGDMNVAPITEEPSRAASIGTRPSYDEDEPDIHVSDEDMARLLEAIKPVLQEIINEIRRSMDYFRNRVKDSGNIDRIVLSGGGSKLRNIDNYISAELGVRVEHANPFVHIDTTGFEQDYLDGIAPLFSISMGLAIRELTSD